MADPLPDFREGAAQDRGEYVDLYYAENWGSSHERVDRTEAAGLRDWLTAWLEKETQ